MFLATGHQVIGTVPLWVDIVAVAVAALPGALIATRIGFDVTGVVLLAIVNGLGGGMIRDTLLQQGTPAALASPWLLVTALAVGGAVFLAATTIDELHGRMTRVITVLDAIVLGLISVVGTSKALDADLPVLSCVLVGVLAGVGGGLIRDVLINEQPEVLRPGTFYALAAAIGCTLLVLTVRLADLHPAWGAAQIVVITAIRLVAVWRGWESPVATDITRRGARRGGRSLRS
jgi:uncharacterized membrane protein YeiH